LKKFILIKDFKLTIVLLFAFIYYLVRSTGIHSDDYQLIEMVRFWTIKNYLFPDLNALSVLIFGPVSYYFDYFSYFIFGFDSLWAYDLVKVFSSTLSVLLIQRFASDYLPFNRAFMAALIYVLLPNHDATLYWVLTLIYVLTPSIIMYSHHLVRHERYIWGVVIGMIGSFASYASPPFTFGLALIFVIQKNYKKAFVFVIPGFLYLIFYFLVQRIPGVSGGRINHELNITSFISMFFLQIGSFLDAAIGPSFWLKIWYSMGSITPVSFVVGCFLIAILSRMNFSQEFKAPISLILGLCAVTFLGLAMFALTGMYPQIAFNLGNRVMVYGTLLMAFLLAILPLSRVSMLGIIAVLLMSALGLSDHWKDWNTRQQEVVRNIRILAPEFSKIPPDSTLLVTGNSYSQLGAISHIEFFSETFGVIGVFEYALGYRPQYRLHTLRSWYRIEGDTLIDDKYGERFSIGEYVWVFNSEANTLNRTSNKELINTIVALQEIPRHWLQLSDENLLRTMALNIMPRLKYVFK